MCLGIEEVQVSRMVGLSQVGEHNVAEYHCTALHYT